MEKHLLVSLMLICCGLFVEAQQQNGGRKTHPEVGPVFGDGDTKSATAIGILKELEREKILVGYIVGTSVSTIIGGLYARGYRADDPKKLFRSQSWLVSLADRSIALIGEVYKKEDDVIFLFGFPIRREADVDRNTGFWMLHGDHIHNSLDSLASHSPI